MLATRITALCLLAIGVAFIGTAATAPQKAVPLVIESQGSFMAGGSVLTDRAGATFHGDHAYVQFQIPVNARKLPLVMWHGAGQFSKTWESTPDGRDGYQSIFLRRRFAMYILDQPRRGRAGRSTVPVTITPDPQTGLSEMYLFSAFRLGTWQPPNPPKYFPGVQFSQDPAVLEQYWRQMAPDTGAGDMSVSVAAVSALFKKIGPAVLLTHSAAGGPGWLTAIANANVKAVVAYEPVGFVFPEGEVPPPSPTPRGPIAGQPVPPADFGKLTKIPIQLVYGDFIPRSPDANPSLERWRAILEKADQFVSALRARGGDVSLVVLPDVGIRGNTHFPFSDLNNVQIADLLSKYLHEKRLD